MLMTIAPFARADSCTRHDDGSTMVARLEHLAMSCVEGTTQLQLATTPLGAQVAPEASVAPKRAAALSSDVMMSMVGDGDCAG